MADKRQNNSQHIYSNRDICREVSSIGTQYWSQEYVYLREGQERGGGVTNERPGSDHVIWGPMSGLEKNCLNEERTDIRTSWLTDQLGPEGPSWWKRECIHFSKQRIMHQLPSIIIFPKMLGTKCQFDNLA